MIKDTQAKISTQRLLDVYDLPLEETAVSSDQQKLTGVANGSGGFCYVGAQGYQVHPFG